ncbi:alpha/beta hydrolase [Streptomyces bambusae]|uniref:alpha/beta fold hydrolase n=1 Tax=Streptomyces bambusae TaxID=1550616 RepID=UPI001CFFB898|nr:alpha/beta hydrolase [Streptomyces bambusae]MCB5170034.1 alpha/beta hydrolase [Streptomyces bambusae]
MTPPPVPRFDGFLRVGGLPLHVRVDGDGPVCVLSAGLGLAWFDWDPVVPYLAPHRTVVRFDRPGHGLSAPAGRGPGAYGALAEADRIAGILDALRLPPGPVTVAGHSIAAFHAEAFARRHPERTAALVLVDGSTEEHPPADPAPALHEAAARLAGRALTATGLPAAAGPLLRRAAVRAARTGGPDPAPRALVRRCYRTGRVWQGALLENAHYARTAAELLRLRETRPLTAPATVLAAYDGSGRPGALRWQARQAALARTLGARFDTAEPAGHLVMADRPHQVARTILAAPHASAP